MEKLQGELDDVKAAMEKLTAEYRIKAELSDSLRKAHNEQLIKLKEAKVEIEKQAQEINAKAEEISASRQLYEDLKSSFREKESVLRHLTSANEKLRADYGEKLQKLEGENKDLAVSLDEATLKSEDQEQKINMYKKEIESLKGRLTISQKKCIEAEESARELKELRQRDDMFLNLEEENRKFKDKLKWKTEQFKHLEEAHKKLQDQFQLSKKEWEKEKSALIDEISSLQTSLDSQTRISESLQNRLQMCNQALAHEESRRKMLEVQMAESKASYENVFSEYQEAKSKIESFTARRDEEIASLRNSLGTKQTLSKEMEYRIEHLEQDNQDLRRSLKEFQEAQIHEAGASSSLSKLRNKLRGLEQVHKECSVNLKARETEWSFQLEKVTGDLNECRSKLACKDEQIQELQMELEGCHSSVLQLKLDYEEMSVLLMVFKSGFSDAQSSLSSLKTEMELLRQEKEEQISLLMEQLEEKNSAFLKAYHELEHGHELTTSLATHIESSDVIEKQCFQMQKELERYKEMLEQSTGQQIRLQEQASEMENALKEELRKVSDALYTANSELVERTQEDFEMQKELERYKEMLEQSSGQQLRLKEQALEMENALKEELRKVSDALYISTSKLAERTQEDFEMQKELERYKEMLEQSSGQQLRLKEQASEMENALKEELRKVSDALHTATSELAERTQEDFEMQKELERYKEMLEQSSGQQLRLKEQASEMENALKEELRKVSDALYIATSELAERTQEESEIEFELARRRSLTERLKSSLEENHETRREIEASILAQVETELTLKQENESLLLAVETKAKMVDDLQKQIAYLEQEKESFLQTVEEKEKIMCTFQQQIACLEEELMTRELEAAILAQTKEEKTMEQEKERLHLVVEETEQVIEKLQIQTKSLEQGFTRSVEASVRSALAEKQSELNMLREAWEKTTTTKVLGEVEIQEKNVIIAELEDEINIFQQKLDLQKESLCCLKQQAGHLEAALAAKQLEMEKVRDQLGNDRRTSEGVIEELESEKGFLHESIMKLSSERTDLMDQIGRLCDQIGEFSDKDTKLMERLGMIVQSIDEENKMGSDLDSDDIYDLNRENLMTPLFSSVKKIEASPGRSPLRDRNVCGY